MNGGLIKTEIEMSSLESVFSALGQMLVDFGLRLGAAILILVIGLRLSKHLIVRFRSFMMRRHLDSSLRSFLLSFLNLLLKMVVVIIALATMGVQMTSIIAVLGAASLAIGMALSGTLQNFAGGIVILLFKPFKVGDTIEITNGETGVVKKIMIFTTEIYTFDNQVVYLPNGSLANGTITNLSRGTLRRTDITFGIAYGSSVERARKVILKIAKDSGYVVSRGVPAPIVFIDNLGDSAVVLTLRYWTKYSDLLAAKHKILEDIYTQLPKNKIQFPFPQMDIHMI